MARQFMSSTLMFSGSYRASSGDPVSLKTSREMMVSSAAPRVSRTTEKSLPSAMAEP